MPGLVIRADASVQMGTGHLMRMLALAQAYANRGGAVTFVVVEAPAPLLRRLESEGFRVRQIRVPPGSRDDAAATAAVASEVQALWIAVDGYQFGGEYQAALKELRFRVLFVDDYGHASHYYADLVLNQNIHADEGWYSAREPHTRLLLGLEYVLLRKEFWPWRRWTRPQPARLRRVLVTLGGSDPANVTARVLELLDRVLGTEGLEVTVVIGAGNPHLEALDRFAARPGTRIRFRRNVLSMSELMAWADLAITSAGSTLWEILFMQLPAIALVIAANQEPVMRFASRFPQVRFVDVLNGKLESELGPVFSDLLSSPRERQVENLTVDGYGGDRIVSAMAGNQSIPSPGSPRVGERPFESSVSSTTGLAGRC